jgi:hypothetical protein
LVVENGVATVFIGAVEEGGVWQSLGKGEITVDSAAEESVCPWGFAEAANCVEGKQMKFVAANGSPIPYWGKRKVSFKTEGETGRMMGVDFHVSDVKKALASVKRICDMGNVVQFGPEAADNFIKNCRSDEKVLMKKKGGSYVLNVELMMPKPSGFRRQENE